MLTVSIVPLKPRNFRENGRQEILEISVSGSVFRESDCFNKYRMYRNCFAFPKFPELLELPEITWKLRKEMEIPVKTSRFLHIHDVRHIHDIAYMNGRRLYGTRNLLTLTGISGVLTGISVSF